MMTRLGPKTPLANFATNQQILLSGWRILLCDLLLSEASYLHASMTAAAFDCHLNSAYVIVAATIACAAAFNAQTHSTKRSVF